LFQPFQRFHPDVAPGEGMGLAIVHRVVDRHGGRTWAESIAGAGSTFYIEIPRLPAEESQASSTPRVEGSNKEALPCPPNPS
jgi:signal transduction histidine kinase